MDMVIKNTQTDTVSFKRFSIGTKGHKIWQENIIQPAAWTIDTRPDGAML